MSFFRIGACKISSNVKFNSSAVDTAYVAPTGGTITTSGNYRIHTFNADGTFAMVGSDKASGYRYWKYDGLPVDYLVIAGGGSGGYNISYQEGCGGGGAGGLRSTVDTSGGNAPIEPSIKIFSSSTVTVGGGGAGGAAANNGSNSTFEGITSIGGGRGALAGVFPETPLSGGSGGGARGFQAGASGTTQQGFDGGNSNSPNSGRGGGGGGSNSAGAGGSASGNGGTGLSISISGSSVTYAGGGGGGGYYIAPTAGGTGQAGGGNGGNNGNNGANATVNTGSGGGGAGGGGVGTRNAGNGGSGIVIVRYLTNR